MRSDRPLINSKRDSSSTSPQRPIDGALKAPNGKLEPIKPKGGPLITKNKDNAIPVIK
jgi:hypothetical protein